MINRRNLLLGGFVAFATAALGAFPSLLTRRASTQEPLKNFEINMTSQEWHQRLSDEQYYILRESGTQRPCSSPLNSEYKKS